MEDRSSPVSRSESDRSHEEVPDTYPRFDIADVSFVCGLRMLTQGMVLEVQSVVSDSIVKLRVRTALDRYIRRVSELIGAKRHSHSSSSPVTPFSIPHLVPQSAPTTCTPTDGIAELPYLPIPEVSALVSQCVQSPDDYGDFTLSWRQHLISVGYPLPVRETVLPSFGHTIPYRWTQHESIHAECERCGTHSGPYMGLHILVYRCTLFYRDSDSLARVGRPHRLCTLCTTPIPTWVATVTSISAFGQLADHLRDVFSTSSPQSCSPVSTCHHTCSASSPMVDSHTPKCAGRPWGTVCTPWSVRFPFLATPFAHRSGATPQ